jgi:hypothetical protein
VPRRPKLPVHSSTKQSSIVPAMSRRLPACGAPANSAAGGRTGTRLSGEQAGQRNGVNLIGASARLVLMTEKEERPAPTSGDRIEFSERSKGVQIIQTAGLPDGWVPPSASLNAPTKSPAQPAVPTTPANARTNVTGTGSGNAGEH